MEKLTHIKTLINETEGLVRLLKDAGATKGQLAPLRRELEALHLARRTAILEAEIKANWVGPAVLEKLGR